MLSNVQSVRMRLAEKGFEYTPDQVKLAIAMYNFSKNLSPQAIQALSAAESPKVKATLRVINFMRSLEDDIFAS